jgi:hypothetical protein
MSVTSFLAVAHSEAWAQDLPSATPEHHSYRNAAGVRIDITVDRSQATDEQVLAALEEATRQARARLAQSARAGAPPLLAPGTPLDSLRREQVPATPPTKSGEELAETSTPAEVNGPVGDDDWLSWLRRLEGTGLPGTLLWEPPLANLHEPRMFVIPNSLQNAHTRKTIDTAIGGDIGLLRITPDCDPAHGFQQDFFAVVFSRFADDRTDTANDFRFGAPLTFACGDWSGKIGYEHTSTHLGDDFIRLSGQSKQGLIRDEIVLGAAYRFWNQLRIYGQFGYALSMSSPEGKKPSRFDWGIEWSQQQNTGWRGQPYAAFDMELREEQDFHPNLSTQLGWQWRGNGNIPSFRMAVEYYDGKSPYGQFFRDREEWVGFGVFIDY